MRVTVDQDRCQGHGLCQMSAPEVFGLREEDGQSYVLLDEIGPDLQEAAREGADSCPERAITVTE